MAETDTVEPPDEDEKTERPLTAKQEQFAQAVALGESATKAYQFSHPEAGYTTAAPMASRWLKKRNVSARVAQIKALRAKAEELSYERAGLKAGEIAARKLAVPLLTMMERRQFLARVMRSDMGNFDIKVDGDLVQEITEEQTPYGTSIRKVKLPGKRECVLDDAKLAGEIIDRQDLTSNGQTLVPQVTVVLQPHWKSIRGQEQTAIPEQPEAREGEPPNV